MESETVTYRRSELYDLVWKEPVRTVARMYGISDVWLAKICRRLSVPLPGRGYWARKRAGWPTKVLPLPPIEDGKSVELVVPKRRQQVFLSRMLPKEEVKPKLVIEVPEKMGRAHPLVTEAGRLLRGRDTSDGYVSCWNVQCLRIRVTKSQLSRALRIMNALLKALEDRGCPVEVTKVLTREEEDRVRHGGVRSNVTRTLVSGEWIEFGIFEKQRTIREEPEQPKGLKGNALETWILTRRPTVRYERSGQLELSILNCEYLGIRRTWGDGKQTTVERSLGTFVTNLEVAAQAIKRDRLEREERERQWQEERRRAEEARERAREEAEREKRLEDRLDRWRLAREAREYVAAARLLAQGARLPADEGLKLTEWLDWIEGFADRIDPLGDLRRRSVSLPSPEENAVVAS